MEIVVDRVLITRPELWPRRPLLPMIRKWDNVPLSNQSGVMIEGVPLTVYYGNIFDPNLPSTTLEHVTYETVDELLEDWTVD